MKTCIFLSKPRSGATVLRNALNSHQSICDIGEIFNDNNDSSYFNFAAGKIVQSTEWVFPRRSCELFQLYVEYCHDLARSWKPGAEVVLLDVKYDHLHFVYKSWQMYGAKPTLFSLVRENGWLLINLRRRNVLDLIISNALAMRDDIYHLARDTAAPKRAEIYLDPVATLAECEALIAEADSISEQFADYGHYFEAVYETLFEAGGAAFSASVLASMSKFMCVSNVFDAVPALSKVVKGNPLDYVANRGEISEVAEALSVMVSKKDK